MTGKLSLDAQEYKDLCDSANDLMQSVTPDGHFRYVNNTWRQVLGYRKREVAGMTVWDIIHPDGLEHCRELFKKVLAGEDVALVATAFAARDGRKILVEGNIKCCFADGKPVYTRAIFRDVTRRRQAEEESRRSREFFKTVFNSISDAVYIINVDDFTIAGANDVFLQTCGLKEEEVIGKTCYEITHHRSAPCTPPDNVCPLNEIITTGEHAVVEHVHYDKDGEKRYVEVSVFPVKNESDRTVQVVHVTRDITERKRIENALQESTEKNQAILDSARNAIISIDSAGDIISWNAGARITFGYAEEEILGKPLAILMPSRFREDHLLAFGRSRSTGKPDFLGNTYEFMGLRKDGSEFLAELSLAGWAAKQGQFFTSIVRDITKRKRLEQEREKLIQELQATLQEVKTLSGLLPICAWCKKFRDDEGYWKSVEEYLGEHAGAEFTHGICPECVAKFFDHD